MRTYWPVGGAISCACCRVNKLIINARTIDAMTAANSDEYYAKLRYLPSRFPFSDAAGLLKAMRLYNNRRNTVSNMLELLSTLCCMWHRWTLLSGIVITFRSRHSSAKCIVATVVCLCVCLSFAAFLHYCTYSHVILGTVGGSPWLCTVAIGAWFVATATYAPNAKCQRGRMYSLYG